MYLQNKQESGGGAPVASPMPKSDSETWREKRICIFQSRVSYLHGVTLSSFMEEGRCPLFMGSRRFPFEMEGEGSALFACYDPFFPLDSQTIRIFCV